MNRPALDTLDATAVRRWAFRARDALAQHRHQIDALNVYPVPDGDTGTNLYLTLHAGLEELVGSFVASAAGPLSMSQAASALARSTLFSARGNSGVILSQLVRGLSDVLVEETDQQSAESAAAALAPTSDEPGIDGPALARVLQKASDYAWEAVSDPVEGTILSVARAAAEAATRASRSTPHLEAVIRAGVEAARKALAATPEQLVDLRQAGVVDAGGAGLLLILEALLQVVTGQEGALELLAGVPEPLPGSPGRRPGAYTRQQDTPDFEVMYLIDGCHASQAATLRTQLESLGDSVLVVGDERVRSVHVHTDDAGAAVEAGLGAGRVYGIRVSSLQVNSHHHEESTECGLNETGEQPATSGIGVVATTQGHGLAELFAGAGALVVSDAPGRRVTPRMLLDAMIACATRTVVVLPCDSDVLLAAHVAADLGREHGLDPVVLATRHSLQGLAALAVFEPGLPDVIEHMKEAAAAVRCGMVVTASSDSATEAGPCRRGDVLGFEGQDVVLVHSDAVEAGVAIVDRLIQDQAEMVTLLAGESAPDLAEQVAARLAQEMPQLEVSALYGGQPVYDLLVGVE
ncbi:DAK2 domain-containing protein [Gephyromycinifex aptenodytis]|uniref:DAK2 domain-containing protein n=1 Tax=Gephyromycinifex aptenodytis TaxID=2716227 RepID=UPI0014461570|nr:DAK2 domain-containing protein [Gephyromycinifex aptenodytis]